MTKKWEQLTDREKIEDLRRDVVKTMNALNALARDVRAQENLASQVAKAVEDLENQSPTSSHKRRPTGKK